MEDPSFTHLTSKRLVIRRFASGDAEALASYRTDEEVARYQDWECPYPISKGRQFIAGLHHLAPGTPGRWFQFAVSLVSSGALLGDVALRTGRADVGPAELGFTLASAHQGQGYATEAVRAVVQYAFGQLAMHRVFSTPSSNRSGGQSLNRRQHSQQKADVEFPGAGVGSAVRGR
jgi:RimJ/RimL family protein N-acetyltransferase